MTEGVKPRRGVSCGRSVPGVGGGVFRLSRMLGSRPTETRLITPGAGSGGGWPPRLRHVQPARSPVGESATSRSGETTEENPGRKPRRKPRQTTTTTHPHHAPQAGTWGHRHAQAPRNEETAAPARPQPAKPDTSDPTIGAPGRLGARTRRSIPNTCRNQDATDPRRQPQQGNRCARTPTDKDTHAQTRREARNCSVCWCPGGRGGRSCFWGGGWYSPRLVCAGRGVGWVGDWLYRGVVQSLVQFSGHIFVVI